MHASINLDLPACRIPHSLTLFWFLLQQPVQVHSLIQAALSNWKNCFPKLEHAQVVGEAEATHIMIMAAECGTIQASAVLCFAPWICGTLAPK